MLVHQVFLAQPTTAAWSVTFTPPLHHLWQKQWDWWREAFGSARSWPHSSPSRTLLEGRRGTSGAESRWCSRWRSSCTGTAAGSSPTRWSRSSAGTGSAPTSPQWSSPSGPPTTTKQHRLGRRRGRHCRGRATCRSGRGWWTRWRGHGCPGRCNGAGRGSGGPSPAYTVHKACSAWSKETGPAVEEKKPNTIVHLL